MTLEKSNNRFSKIDLSNVDWPTILAAHPFNLEPSIFNGIHQPCPIEQEGKDRFRWDKNRMIFFCNTCQPRGGNGMTLLMKLMDVDFVGGLNLLNGNTRGEKPKQLPKIKAVAKPIDKTWCKKVLQTTWDESKPIEGTPAEVYLKRRVPGLDLNYLSRYFRFHPELEHTQITMQNGKEVKIKSKRPALLNMVVSEIGEPITIHRTYLSNDGFKASLDVKEIKKLTTSHKNLNGDAIHLNKGSFQSEVLMVCEGIETGLALVMASGNSKEVWSMMVCGNLAKAKIPKRFKTVIIAADHDPFNKLSGFRPGEHHAEILARRLKDEGFKVTLRRPKGEQVDYCDLWVEMSKKRLSLAA